ncbi:MAG: hypothetical protein KatS3mg083_088 [Candidatus Dojkabacteria bacterium]|nr:MAG: hypothetical protein KatS3mg083_088 [Candidatus Dojkabacteria bacterium]
MSRYIVPDISVSRVQQYMHNPTTTIYRLLFWAYVFNDEDVLGLFRKLTNEDPDDISTEDVKKLVELYYDRYNYNLAFSNAIVRRSIKNTIKDILVSKEQPMYLKEREYRCLYDVYILNKTINQVADENGAYYTVYINIHYKALIKIFVHNPHLRTTLCMLLEQENMRIPMISKAIKEEIESKQVGDEKIKSAINNYYDEDELYEDD